jgi:hypothetical protein
MLDCIATVNCSKSYPSGESQWNFLSFESRFGVQCKSNNALLCMCRKSNDQRSREYCSGNDYGRLGSYKPLNGTTRNACVPVRLYKIDLQIRANHSTNHSIAFPMNGPVECLKKLPCLDETFCPQVTFLGPTTTPPPHFQMRSCYC